MAVHFGPVHKAHYNEHPAQDAPESPSLASKLAVRDLIARLQKEAEKRAKERENGKAVPSIQSERK